jgi:hypothetical protein
MKKTLLIAYRCGKATLSWIVSEYLMTALIALLGG